VISTLKNVLAATDFSGPSRHAAERAARPAHVAGARLQLLHVLSGRALTQLQHLLGQDSAVEQGLIDEAGRTLDNLASELALAQGVAIEAKLVSGSVLADIGGQAEQAATQQLNALAAGAGLKPADWSPCVLHGDASLCIIEQEQEQDCDLIVIDKHGQNMADDLLLGSVAKHVLAESAGDVLVSTLRLA